MNLQLLRCFRRKWFSSSATFNDYCSSIVLYSRGVINDIFLFRGNIYVDSINQVNKGFNKKIEDGNVRDQKSFDKWAKSHIGKQRSDKSHRIDAEDRSTNGNDDSLDLQLSEGESFGRQGNPNSQENLRTDFIRVYENDGTNRPRYIPIGKDVSQFYQTEDGKTIYGFADNAGNIQHEINMKLKEEQKKMTLQEEIESWQEENWPPGFMAEQTERNHKMIEMKDKKNK